MMVHVRRIQTIQDRTQSGPTSVLLLRRYTEVVNDCIRLGRSDDVSQGLHGNASHANHGDVYNPEHDCRLIVTRGQDRILIKI